VTVILSFLLFYTSATDSLIGVWRQYVFPLSVRVFVLRKFMYTIFHKPLGELHQIYTAGVLGDTDELI